MHLHILDLVLWKGSWNITNFISYSILTIRSFVLLAVLLFAMCGMETSNTIAQSNVTDELKQWGLHMKSYSKSCQRSFCRPEISVCTTHFLHHSCYTLFIYRRHMLFVSCLVLVVIRMQNTRVLKGQEFNFLTGQEIPCMLLNQSVFHFRCHSSSPLLSWFEPV